MLALQSARPAVAETTPSVAAGQSTKPTVGNGSSVNLVALENALLLAVALCLIALFALALFPWIFTAS